MVQYCIGGLQMTEAARKTLEEIERSTMEKLNKEVSKKSLGEACDEAMTAIAILSGVINKVVNECEDDPVVILCGAKLSGHLLETTKAISTFNQLVEAAEIIKEQEKNK